MDPLQAANILFGVWSALQGGESQDEGPSGAGGTRDLEPVARQAVERQLAEAKERMDRLVLVVHAMWTLVSEKTGLTEAELLQRINDLDAADGVIDGRVVRPPMRCSCGAMVSRKMHRCLFCGKEAPDAGAFERL
jgi:hypothetical protein